MKISTIRKVMLVLVALAATIVSAAQADYTWQICGETVTGLFTDSSRWNFGAVPCTGYYQDLANINQTAVFSADGNSYTVSFPSGAYTPRRERAPCKVAAALAGPAAVFETAGKVAEMWVRRYAPEVAPPPPPPVAGLRGGKSAVAVGDKQSAVGSK